MTKIETALELLQKFNDNNYEAYIVGGAVRDLLMEREIKDIDITTDALPEQMIEFAKQNNLRYIETGLQHGTITIIYKDLPVEVTTFRVDTNCDGRHCEVEFIKTLKEDLARRDFTINAMAMDKECNLYDYFGGQEDIKNKKIRTVGLPKRRYAEDKLRLLRAVRFNTVLDFSFEERTCYDMFEFEETLKTISKHEFWNDIEYTTMYSKPVSDERIKDEFTKIIMSNNRIRGLALLDSVKLLVQILPELVELKNTEQSKVHHPEGNVFTHTRLALDSVTGFDICENPSLELLLAIILHDIGKYKTTEHSFTELGEIEIHSYEHENIGAEIAKKILTRMKFSSETIDKVVWLVQNHMRIHYFSEMKKSKKVKLIEHEYFDDLFKLSEADILGSGVRYLDDDKFNNSKEIINFIKDYEIEKQNRPVLTQKLINGYDVMNLGLTPKDGVKIGKILGLVNDAVIEGKINSREEALEFVKELINNG